MVNKNKFTEEDASGYRVDILGRNIEVTEPLRNYLLDKLSKLERFHNHIMHVHATFDMQKLEHSCSIVLKIDHVQVKSKASSTDMYVSIDRAVDRLQTLLRRYKSRIQDHHKRGPSIVDVDVNVFEKPYDEVAAINAEIEADTEDKLRKSLSLPKVVGTEKKPLKTLTIREAMMKMDLTDDPFLVFRSEEDQKLKVLYQRSDGHYGLIQPE